MKNSHTKFETASQSNLKRWSLGFFEELAPTKKEQDD